MASYSFAAGKSCVTKLAEGTGGTRRLPSSRSMKRCYRRGLGCVGLLDVERQHPGYSYGKRTYKCKGGSGLGYTCRGTSTICKI